jgi:Ca-activated chloride channel family protein
MNAGTLTPLLFDQPWMLIAALLLPACVWWLRVVRQRRRAERLSRYAESGALRRLAMINDPDERGRTVRLMCIALLAGVALAGPRWGLARGPVSARGIDMAIAIDASLSMMATDERPSRLERVKQEVRRLRAMSQADRVALIAFAGRSYILTPLTSDDGAIELFLDNLDPSVVGQAGSSIARAIRQGTELLLASDGSADRALVIMTDGEAFEPEEDVRAAATEAGTKGISVVAVGFGTTQGSTIPVQEGTAIREKRDDDGNVVITRYAPALLEAAAKAAGGTFVPAEASDKATRVRGALRLLRTAKRTVDSREEHVPRFLWLLLPALLLLLYDTWLLSHRRAGDTDVTAPSYPPPSATLALWLTVLPLLVSCAQPPDPAARFADGDIAGAIAAYRAQRAAGDTSGRTRYNLGSALLGADSLPEASELLEAVRRDSDGEVRMRARFNAGLAALIAARQPGNAQADESFAAARAAYRAFLTERPADRDAKWNFELALRKTPPPQSGGGGGGGESPNTQQDQQPQEQAGLDKKQAEALLNSAAREERDVQGRKQRQGRTPPRGKDW